VAAKGRVAGWGMRPRATIGSANTTRTSFACSRLLSSPSGPELRTRSSPADVGTASAIAAHASHPALIIPVASVRGMSVCRWTHRARRLPLVTHQECWNFFRSAVSPRIRCGTADPAGEAALARLSAMCDDWKLADLEREQIQQGYGEG